MRKFYTTAIHVWKQRVNMNRSLVQVSTYYLSV